MKNVYGGPEELNAKLLQASKQLMANCDGCLLPFDTYCMAATLRAMDSVHAYGALAQIDNFLGCCIITRSQLDTLFRLNGVLKQPDPHTLAQRLISGESLRRIKGTDGKKLVDGHLVELLSDGNVWVTPAYELLNQFVHLSPQHFNSMMAQGLHSSDGVVTIQYLGDSSYVQGKDKAGVNSMFVKITEGVSTLLRYWASRRSLSPATKVWLAKAQAAGVA